MLSSRTRPLIGTALLAICLTCAHSGSLPASAAGRPAIAVQDFETEAEFFEEGAEAAKAAHNARGAGPAAGRRAALAPAMFTGSPRPGARVMAVSTVTVTRATADRPIKCTFRIYGPGGYFDFYYDAWITNPNNVTIAQHSTTTYNKWRAEGSVGVTLTDPIVLGTYKCWIYWEPYSPETGTVGLPTGSVTLGIS
jgi:hypothetical protein